MIWAILAGLAPTLILLLTMSALISAAETSMTAASRGRMHQLEREGDQAARPVQRLAIEGRLGLIDDQQVGPRQQAVGHSRRWRQIGDLEPREGFEGVGDDADRDFQLADQGVRRDRSRRLDRAIGSGADRDLVLALGRNGDQGHPGRLALVHEDARQIRPSLH